MTEPAVKVSVLSCVSNICFSFFAGWSDAAEGNGDLKEKRFRASPSELGCCPCCWAELPGRENENVPSVCHTDRDLASVVGWISSSHVEKQESLFFMGVANAFRVVAAFYRWHAALQRPAGVF